MSEPLISVITPTFNERENILNLVKRVHNALVGYAYELIIVDDNSPDGTAEFAESLSGEYPLRVICRRNERGLSSAVIAGFRQARGKILGVIDADLQHPPEEIPALIHSIEDGADVAIGSRYILGGGIRGWSVKRKLVSQVATTLARLFLPSIRKTKDPMSGFFMVRREVIENVELRPIGYKILLEVLAKGKLTPHKVREVPYTFQEREAGKSNLNMKEQVNYLKHLSILVEKDKEIRRVAKFLAVGLSGTGVNLGVLFLLTAYSSLSPLVAGIASIELAIISNFILNDIWTFGDRRTPSFRAVLKRGLKYNTATAVSAGASYAVFFWLLTGMEGMHYLVCMALGILAGFVWNFTWSMLWAWRKGEPREEPLLPK